MEKYLFILKPYAKDHYIDTYQKWNFNSVDEIQMFIKKLKS